MGRHGAGRLIVALFVGSLIGNVAAEVLKILLRGVGLSQTVVEKVLAQPLVQYEFPPACLNFIVLTLTFGFTLHFSLLTLLGMGLGWYYFKYSY